jgi:hypothetical protein
LAELVGVEVFGLDNDVLVVVVAGVLVEADPAALVLTAETLEPVPVDVPAVAVAPEADFDPATLVLVAVTDVLALAEVEGVFAAEVDSAALPLTAEAVASCPGAAELPSV